jgi:hypothetical protein
MVRDLHYMAKNKRDIFVYKVPYWSLLQNNTVQVVLVIVLVIDDRCAPLVAQHPLPTLGLRPFTKSVLHHLRDGQVLLPESS